MSTFEYHRRDYPRHRQAFVTQQKGFIPSPRWAEFTEPGERLPEFVACLAGEILLSQAVHAHFPQHRTSYLTVAGIPRLAGHISAGFLNSLLACESWQHRFPAEALRRPLLAAMIIMYRRFAAELRPPPFSVAVADFHRALCDDRHLQAWAQQPPTAPVRHAYEAIGLAFEIFEYFDDADSTPSDHAPEQFR